MFLFLYEKEEMSSNRNVPKTRPEILKDFTMRHNSLSLAMKNYDEGHKSEAMTLASIITTFVYDHGKKIQSLLTLIDIKEDFYFKDTAGPIIGNNLMADALLCIGVFGAQSGSYEAPLNESIGNYPDLKFDEWWNAIVFKSPAEQKEMSRRDIVLGMRNMAGGSHVSPNWDENFAALVRDNPGGLVFFTNDRYYIPEFGPEYASIRQIAYELDYSLRRVLSL